MADTNCRNHFGVTDMSGKGSTRRPMNVPDQTFWDNFDRIFGEGKNEPKQREDANRVSSGSDDLGPKTNGSEVPNAGKPGT